MKKTLLQTVLLVFLAAAAGAASNIARSGNREKHLPWWPEIIELPAQSVPETGPEAKPGDQPQAAEPFPPINLARMLDELRGGAVLIDGRRSREYAAGHIPGAFSISAWESPGEKVSEFLEKGAVVEAPVVVYCGSAKECEDSKIVCGVLQQAGFVNLMIYRGGFPEWQSKMPGLVVKGEEPGELDLAKLPEETKP